MDLNVRQSFFVFAFFFYLLSPLPKISSYACTTSLLILGLDQSNKSLLAFYVMAQFFTMPSFSSKIKTTRTLYTFFYISLKCITRSLIRFSETLPIQIPPVPRPWSIHCNIKINHTHVLSRFPAYFSTSSSFSYAFTLFTFISNLL